MYEFLFNLPIDKLAGLWYNGISARCDSERAAQKFPKCTI